MKIYTPVQANPQDVLDFHHLHFKVNGVSDLTFQAYSADYKFYDAGSHQHRSVEVSLQPQVATFEVRALAAVGTCGRERA